MAMRVVRDMVDWVSGMGPMVGLQLRLSERRFPGNRDAGVLNYRRPSPQCNTAGEEMGGQHGARARHSACRSAGLARAAARGRPSGPGRCHQRGKDRTLLSPAERPLITARTGHPPVGALCQRRERARRPGGSTSRSAPMATMARPVGSGMETVMMLSTNVHEP